METNDRGRRSTIASRVNFTEIWASGDTVLAWITLQSFHSFKIIFQNAEYYQKLNA
jgi:hypothetical protein